MAFAEILARASGQQAAELTRTVAPTAYTTLQRARVRLDMIAMMLCRQFWASMLASGNDVHAYIFCDASLFRRALSFSRPALVCTMGVASAGGCSLASPSIFS